MKGVFVNRFFYPDHSATSQILSDLAFFLAETGYQVQVVTSRLAYGDPGAALPAQELVGGVRIQRVWTSRFGRDFLPGRALDYLTFYLSATWALFRLVRRDDLVVAKTDPPLISVPAGWVAALRGARLVNWLQDLFPEVAAELGMGLARGLVGRLLMQVRNHSLRRAVTNVAIGQRMMTRLVAQGGDRARVCVIHNWADGERIRPRDPEGQPLRAEWGLSGKFVIGYSGNLGRAHEYATLLGAAERLRADPNIVFLFVGGGALMPSLKAEVRALGLSNVLFRPYQPRERLAESLGVADVHLVVLRPELEGLIVPSKLYGIPGGLAAWRPTLNVGSPQGEVAESIRDAEAGFTTEIGDVDALARRIRHLKGDADLRRRMGENARRLFDGRFSKARAMGEWDDLLRGLEPEARS